MEPAEALADLKQISTQVERAVIVGSDGAVEASTFPDAAAGARMAASGKALYDAADRMRSDLGRPALTQLEVATPEGSVFAVRGAGRTIVAVTAVDPTVGLIFYDLKTCLRNLEDDADPADVDTDPVGVVFGGGAEQHDRAPGLGAPAADPTAMPIVEDAAVSTPAPDENARSGDGEAR